MYCDCSRADNYKVRGPIAKGIEMTIYKSKLMAAMASLVFLAAIDGLSAADPQVIVSTTAAPAGTAATTLPPTGGCPTCGSSSGSKTCATCGSSWFKKHDKGPYVVNLCPGACFGYFQTQWRKWDDVCPYPYQGIGVSDAPKPVAPALPGVPGPSLPVPRPVETKTSDSKPMSYNGVPSIPIPGYGATPGSGYGY
jgi:hypothetical protein